MGDEISMKNEEGYLDPTPHDAIENIKEETADAEKSRAELERFTKLLHTIFYICGLAGFKVRGRITLVDKETGRVWR